METLSEKVATLCEPLTELTDAIAKLCVLLYDRGFGEGQNEILGVKIMVLLCGNQYHSHADCLFRMNNGSWKRCEAISASCLEFIGVACRYSQAIFIVLSDPLIMPDRDEEAVCKEARRAVRYLPKEFLRRTFLSDVTKRSNKEKNDSFKQRRPRWEVCVWKVGVLFPMLAQRSSGKLTLGQH